MEEVSMSKLKYEHPLVDRYASKEMSYLWSPTKKFSTWRKLWIALAESEKDLGLDITAEQIAEMKEHIMDIDFELADQKETEFRHDVMAHVHTFGTAAPKAMPIIHLGATSCYVGDNTDIIQMKESLILVRSKLVKLMSVLKGFSQKYADMPCLGFTHCQPAQLTTVGKRCCLWMQDFYLDFGELDRLIADLPMRGVKGTTGTQATFLGNIPQTFLKLIFFKLIFFRTFSYLFQTFLRIVFVSEIFIVFFCSVPM